MGTSERRKSLAPADNRTTIPWSVRISTGRANPFHGNVPYIEEIILEIVTLSRIGERSKASMTSSRLLARDVV